MSEPIPDSMACDPRDRAATSLLIDSLYQQGSVPLAVMSIVAEQHAGLFRSNCNPRHCTAFSFTRFLVPSLKGCRGWAIFMDCDTRLWV